MWSFCTLTKNFWYCRQPDTVSKIESLWDSWGSNDWFKSKLSNRNQYVSINVFDSGLTTINCGIPQGSVLGPLQFSSHINDLNQAIKFCKVHQFADDFYV